MARWTSSRIAAACLMAAAPVALAAGLWQAGVLRMPGSVGDSIAARPASTGLHAAVPPEHTGTVLDGRRPDDDPAPSDASASDEGSRQAALIRDRYNHR